MLALCKADHVFIVFFGFRFLPIGEEKKVEELMGKLTKYLEKVFEDHRETFDPGKPFIVLTPSLLLHKQPLHDSGPSLHPAFYISSLLRTQPPSHPASLTPSLLDTQPPSHPASLTPSLPHTQPPSHSASLTPSLPHTQPPNTQPP